MMWAIQNNLLDDDAYWRITVALDEMGIPWRKINVIPFADELTDFEGLTNPVVFYGSTSLQRQVINHGKFVPGVWAGSNFDYMLHIEKYGIHMLNYDAEIYPFKDVPVFDDIMFMRPVHDTKSFTGTLVGGDEFETWKNNLLGVAGWNNNPAYDGFMETWKSSVMTPDTPTMVCAPKNVRQEYRFFVVDKKVITGSLYHVNDRLVKKRFEPYVELDEVSTPFHRAIWDFAQARVNEWQPADAFVIDIGVLGTEEDYEFKIVEFNSFNCSGIYDCDERKIVRAVDDMIVRQQSLQGYSKEKWNTQILEMPYKPITWIDAKDWGNPPLDK